MKRLALVAGLVIVALARPMAAQPKYTATVTADKATDFTTLKTYVWQSGWDANDKKIHGQIVAAVDKELKALGFTLKPSGPSDVVVKYASLRRIDVEVNTSTTATAADARGQIDVGSLRVVMLQPGTGKELLRGSIDKRIELGSTDQVEAAINGAVAEIFAKYPTRVKK